MVDSVRRSTVFYHPLVYPLAWRVYRTAEVNWADLINRVVFPHLFQCHGGCPGEEQRDEEKAREEKKTRNAVQLYK